MDRKTLKVEENPKLNEMLELLRRDEDLDMFVAELRDSFLDLEAISKENGYDVLPEVASCPKHVLLYTAMYIDMLKSKSK